MKCTIASNPDDSVKWSIYWAPAFLIQQLFLECQQSVRHSFRLAPGWVTHSRQIPQPTTIPGIGLTLNKWVYKKWTNKKSWKYPWSLWWILTCPRWSHVAGTSALLGSKVLHLDTGAINGILERAGIWSYLDFAKTVHVILEKYCRLQMVAKVTELGRDEKRKTWSIQNLYFSWGKQ